MITQPEALAEWIEKLRGHSRIALDTEADSLHCYFEKLCLIQISIPGEDALIDPLCELSLAPLYEELGRHEMVIQGLDYDLRLMRRHGLQTHGDIFDTMIAARLIGSLEFSLAALIQTHFGITLAKGSQKANWARRPLSPRMEEYAQNDTRYLLPLAEILEAELHRLGRWDWFTQSCQKAIEATLIKRERDENTVWKVTGGGDLRGLAAAYLRGLWFWRDEEARAVDRPPFHIARNDQLIEGAKTLTAGGLYDLPHLSPNRRKRLFAAIEAVRVMPESEWPRPIRGTRTRTTPEQEKHFEALKKVRDAAAEEYRIDPSLIAPRNLLEAFTQDPEGTLPRILPWQRMLLKLEG